MSYRDEYPEADELFGKPTISQAETKADALRRAEQPGGQTFRNGNRLDQSDLPSGPTPTLPKRADREEEPERKGVARWGTNR